jgi:hypothetical protein
MKIAFQESSPVAECVKHFDCAAETTDQVRVARNAVNHFWDANVAGFVRNRCSTTLVERPVSHETSYPINENG